MCVELVCVIRTSRTDFIHALFRDGVLKKYFRRPMGHHRTVHSICFGCCSRCFAGRGVQLPLLSLPYGRTVLWNNLGSDSTFKAAYWRLCSSPDLCGSSYFTCRFICAALQRNADGSNALQAEKQTLFQPDVFNSQLEKLREFSTNRLVSVF